MSREVHARPLAAAAPSAANPPLRLDLLERTLARVETLLGAVPDGADPTAARIWLADAEALVAAAGEFDRTRLLDACSRVRELLARRADPAERPRYRDLIAAADLHERVGESAHAAAGFTAAAIAALRCDDVSEALDLAVRGLVAFEALSGEIADPLVEARMADSLSRLCREFFDHERALRFAEIAIVDLDPRSHPRRWSEIAVQLADVALLLAREIDPGDPRRTRLLDRAEEIGVQLMVHGKPTVVRQVSARRLVAEARCERHPDDAALALLDGVPSAGGAVRLARGRCLYALGRPVEALVELDAAIGAGGEGGDLADHIAALQLRAAAREAAGDAAGALADLRLLTSRLWERHQRQIGGFMDQLWGRAGAEGRRRVLEAREEVLIRTAEQDPLTGLANRRGVERFCAGLPGSDPVCLVMIDVDHFKSVNDRYGHAIGDAVLRDVAAVLGSCVRAVDRVARWGGEEFLIALPSGSVALGAEAARRARRRVTAHDWGTLASGLRLTVSAGVACGLAGDFSVVLDLADEALYSAKRSGRDRVVTA